MVTLPFPGYFSVVYFLDMTTPPVIVVSILQQEVFYFTVRLSGDSPVPKVFGGLFINRLILE